MYTAASVLSPKIGEYAKKVHSELSRVFAERGVEDKGLLLSPDDVKKGEGCSILLVATGGTEVTTLKLYEIGDKPLVLVATGLANSLAAALESIAALKSKGVAVELLYYDDWSKVNVEEVLSRAMEVKRFYEIKGTRIGAIGGPSPWLVASSVDYSKAREKLGVEFVRVPLEEFIEEYKTRSLSDKDWKKVEELAKNSARIDIPVKSLGEAYRLYLAVKEVIRRHKLDSITIRCFDLIKELGTTACLTLSLLNSELIVAGCEGDGQSVLTMLILSKLSGKPAWMANPVKVDLSANEIMLAHCTAPVAIGVYKFKTHFESGICVGLDVVYKKSSQVTIARVSGDVEKILVATGEIVESGMESPLHCRTQVRIRLHGSVKRLLDNMFGNHLAMVPEDISDLVERYAELSGLKIVRI